MFVDRVEIEVLAGRGGDGCVSFRRERYIARGGPDGGDGGHGGSIIMRATPGTNSLVNLGQRRHYKAERGQNGSGSNRTGRCGQDMVLDVPPGTVIWDSEREFVLKDLAKAGDEVVVARGGKGGKGNVHFKSSTNQAPREHTPGDDGEHRKLTLELKVIADVGLIGKPNAGKSTLLSRLSRATPEIADYPFTTKFPNLGIVQIDRDRTFVMADIPGLIEGAHSGVGLGHEFLRHVERAGILVHLVEPQPVDGTDPLENYTSIREELRLYNDELATRPEVLVVTKCELPEAGNVRDALAEQTGNEVLLISAVTGAGLNQLVGRVAEHLSENAT